MTRITCAHCGKQSEKATGAVNRALKKGAPLYCNKACFGFARRQHKTDEQKREEKRIYDIEYRCKNKEILKVKKAAYFQRSYDPVKAAEYRKKRMSQHIEYCRRPAYREYKQRYDRIYKAKQSYGEFWECQVLTLDIRDEVLSRQSAYEIRLEKGTLGKSQKRKRDYERTIRTELESGSLGNLERHQRR